MFTWCKAEMRKQQGYEIELLQTQMMLYLGMWVSGCLRIALGTTPRSALGTTQRRPPLCLVQRQANECSHFCSCCGQGWTRTRMCSPGEHTHPGACTTGGDKWSQQALPVGLEIMLSAHLDCFNKVVVSNNSCYVATEGDGNNTTC